MLKRVIVFITVFAISTTLWAEQYQLISNARVYIKTSETEKERSILPKQFFPNANVYVRMLSSSKEKNETFTIGVYKDSVKIAEYLCQAPTEWSEEYKTLKECLLTPIKPSKTWYTDRNAIARGALLRTKTHQFHYLCVLVSDFDDTQTWESFPYNDCDISAMKNAFNSINNQQQYAKGKQYLLSNPQTTQSTIISCMDSIVASTNKEDFIILYLSSHGEKDQQKQFHFITKDSHKDSKNGKLINSITQNDINNYVNELTTKGARVLLFIDACYAGAILDNDIHGEAAYYLSTGKNSPAYHNHFLGSPFAIALMEVMSGTLNGIDNNCFNEDKVQVGSLGHYLSNAVYKYQNQEQDPTKEIHDFNPAYVLWHIRNSHVIQSSSQIIDLERLSRSEQLSASERAKVLIQIGDCYYNGDGTNINFDTALSCYRDATDLNSKDSIQAKAYMKIAKCLYYGNPYKDLSQAHSAAKKAANLGDFEACYWVGLDLINGEGIDKDIDEGVKWIKKAAKKGYPQAQRQLGLCYILGECVKQDMVKAFKWIEKAAEKDEVAQYFLGLFYYKGEGGTPQDYFKAVECFTKAAEKELAPAQRSLGNCYFYGHGITQDYMKAAEWLTKAANQGDDYAQNSLGYLYHYGLGVTINYATAYKLYTAAAEQENIYAYTNLGTMYCNGEGVPQNYTKGIEWYTKAAEQNEPTAQANLGDCYYYGDGVQQDFTTAVEWYTKGSKQGDVYSQYMMGWCYFNGKGVEKDHELGLKLIQNAANHGEEKAIKFIKDYETE